MTILPDLVEFGLREDAVVRLPGLSDAAIYAWRGDNAGPPESVEEVLATFDAVRKLVPTAEKVIASDLDTFLAKVDTPAVRTQLPVVATDLAEGWVYGASHDCVNLPRADMK